MNSYRRPRSRPRKRSINLRSFFWVLEREAVFHVLTHTLWCAEPQRWARAELARYNRTQLYHLFTRAWLIYSRLEE